MSVTPALCLSLCSCESTGNAMKGPAGSGLEDARAQDMPVLPLTHSHAHTRLSERCPSASASWPEAPHCCQGAEPSKSQPGGGVGSSIDARHAWVGVRMVPPPALWCWTSRMTTPTPTCCEGQWTKCTRKFPTPGMARGLVSFFDCFVSCCSFPGRQLSRVPAERETDIRWCISLYSIFDL